MNKAEHNRLYAQRRGPIFQFTESELEPSAIRALIENLDAIGWHPADKRRERLVRLLAELIGERA